MQVRASAVYALGTFINSVTERSEHANNIDQSVAMMLINTVAQDMCPLVRKVNYLSLLSYFAAKITSGLYYFIQ